jgi:hypothetical protein
MKMRVWKARNRCANLNVPVSRRGHLKVLRLSQLSAVLLDLHYTESA